MMTSMDVGTPTDHVVEGQPRSQGPGLAKNAKKVQSRGRTGAAKQLLSYFHFSN